MSVAQSNFVAMSKALGKVELDAPDATTAPAPSDGVNLAQAKPKPAKRTTNGRTPGPQLRTANRGTQRR